MGIARQVAKKMVVMRFMEDPLTALEPSTTRPSTLKEILEG
jgi:hypothetical protein